MAYRKLFANRLFNGTRFLNDTVLVVAPDGRIEALLPAADVSDPEIYEGILSPGFINCHCHLELSHMKGHIPEGTGLVDFVFAVVTQRHTEPVAIEAAIVAAEEEMLRNGIVAVGDICNNTSTLQQKRAGNLYYYNFIESSGWLPGVAQGRLERALDLWQAFSETGPSSIVPHAPYSVSAELWHLLAPHFAGRVVTLHNQETPFEDEFFERGTGDFNRMYALMNIDNSHHAATGRSSLQSCYPRLLPASVRLLVHNTFTRPEDVRMVVADEAHPSFFCLCVNANQYIERSLPPVKLLRSESASIVLGTDSLASNHSLGIHDELRTLRTHFPEVPLQEMLRWATWNGARALQMEERLGSFERGKMPGVLLLDEGTLAVKRLV